jgi:hypothetical protein
MSNPSDVSTQELADPLVHTRAVAASALVGVGLTASVGLLWTAVAFSSHESWAYGHLAWWLGATMIGAALIAGIVAGGLSSTRGASAGAVNGLASGAALVAVAGTVALIALAVNGSFDQSLVFGGHSVVVDFVRPYVAFWTAAASFVLAGIGGAAGGLLPRRRAGHQVVELAPVSSIRTEAFNVTDSTGAPTASGF